MNWKEALGIIVGFGVLIQIFYWLLGVLGVHEEIGIRSSLFVSANFTLLVAIILVIIQQ
jgi:hypothetical protein